MIYCRSIVAYSLFVNTKEGHIASRSVGNHNEGHIAVEGHGCVDNSIIGDNKGKGKERTC
jgi:hypothetical protein